MPTISANGSKGHHSFSAYVIEKSWDQESNSSVVQYSFTMSPIQTGWDWNWNDRCVSCTLYVNGKSYSKDLYQYDGSSTVTLASGTQTVPHNDDGSKTISFSFSVSDGVNQTYSTGNASASGSLTLTNITRHFDITYDANNGENEPDAQIKTYGEDIMLATNKPTRTGYTFKGWATSADSTEIAYNSGDSYTANEDLDLFAVWEINYLTISYDANGGTDIHLSQVKTYGEDLTLYTLEDIQSNGYDLKRTGWTFDSWNTASDGSGTQFNLGDTYTDDSKIEISDASITLYAQWNKKTYDVLFDANLGELGNVPTSLTKTYGENLILPTEEPARELWNFLGWSDDPKGAVLYTKGAAYTDDSPLIPDVQTITSVTLYAVWELAYISPTISDLTVCRNNGTEDDEEGTYIHLTGSWSVDTTIQTDAVADGLIIEYKVSDSDTWIEASNTNPNAQSGTIDTIIGDGTILPNESYFVRVTVTDWGGQKSARTILPQQFRTFDVGNNGKSVGFGMPADDDVEGMDISMDVRFHDSAKNIWGNIPMKHISGGEDLDDYKTVGFYYCDSDGYGDGTWNRPAAFEDISFALEVLYGGQDGEIIQRATRCHKDEHMVCQRIYYDNSWGAWQTILMNGQKVLWEGEKFMNEDQAIDLSYTPISQQENGIVLVFSAFSESAAVDYHWQFKFIPKYFANYNVTGTSSNKGVSIALTAKSFEYIGTKLLFINDDRIEGHESNQATGTNNGISFNNAHWVLRYILGC